MNIKQDNILLAMICV